MDRDKLDEIFGERGIECLMLICSFIHGKCNDYALSKMKEDDFISFKDANNIKTNGIFVLKGKDKIASTLRRTSKDKYEDFYDKRFISTIEKITNAE